MSNSDADNVNSNHPATDDGDDIVRPSIHTVTDEELRDFCDEIVLCLQIYGKLDEHFARQQLDESGMCSPDRVATDLARSLLFHEEPYYWAMEFMYGRTYPRWWNEPSLGKLWPPPAEYHHPDWPDNVLRKADQE